MLTVAIIGAGKIAGGYDYANKNKTKCTFTHIGAYQKHGGFIVKTIFDINSFKASRFAKKWGIEKRADNIHEIYKTYHDVISICTPDSTHYEIIKKILKYKCCKTIFVEKPLATKRNQITIIRRLSKKQQVHVVVNFQRRNEPTHKTILWKTKGKKSDVISVSAFYVKGLQHVGISMIDTLFFLFGAPRYVRAIDRRWCREVAEHSYDFVFYYPKFNIFIKSADSEKHGYTYHLFEIDILLRDQRIRIVDNSNGVMFVPKTDYEYPGVKTLNERRSKYRETRYKQSMIDAVRYVRAITIGKKDHSINTVKSSYENQLVLESIVESFTKGSKLIKIASINEKDKT